MEPRMSKRVLLNLMRTGYAAFDALLDGLNEDGVLTIAGVNGSWSIKDNMAHLTWWQKRVLTTLQEARQNGGQPPVDPVKGMSEDEINEKVYQENKDRSLDEVWNDFRTVSTDLIAHIETLSDEEVNSPPYSGARGPIWPWIMGNTYWHYHEHAHIIQGWLDKQDS